MESEEKCEGHEHKEKEVEMTAKQAVKEHKHLVKVLKDGTKGEQHKEAKKQSKELKEYEGKLSKHHSATNGSFIDARAKKFGC